MGSMFTEKKSGKCALNDFVFKFKICSVEILDLNINTNLADLLVLCLVSGELWPRTSLNIYKSLEFYIFGTWS